tara:strand:- start:1961 stop:2152 length:192 start_codon:yes stop_codon:yes gene_type:complete
MSNKIKALEDDLVVERVHELMAEGKASATGGWQLSNIVNTIGEEFGAAQSVLAFQYIVDSYGK